MSSCRHKNVVSYFVSFTEHSDLWLVMPLLGAGSVADVLKINMPKGIKDEVLIATILQQVIEGLNYFHQSGQIHRDIKAGNVLMDDQGDILLSDFGVSAHIKGGQRRTTFVGSPCWMAPEVMAQTQEGYDFKADIWSLGITAIELAHGDAPYSDLHAMKVLMAVLNSQPPTLNVDENWSPEFKFFVSSCLKKDPVMRPKAEDLLMKPEFREFLDKGKDKNIIKTNFLFDLKPLEQRAGKPLKAQGNEYLARNQRKASKTGLSGQRLVEKKEAGASGDNWDFSASDGKDDVTVK